MRLSAMGTFHAWKLLLIILLLLLHLPELLILLCILKNVQTSVIVLL